MALALASFLFLLLWGLEEVQASGKVAKTPAETAAATPSASELPRAWQAYDEEVLTVKLGFEAPSLQLEVTDKVGKGNSILFRPNVPTNLVLGASYDWMSARVSLPGTLSRDDVDRKGKTTSNDWQLRMNFRQLSVDAFYQNYEGYYIENSAEFGSLPDSYLQAPDLRNEYIGAGFVWNFNPDDFSMVASFDQSTQQIRSGWSWLGGASIHSNRFTSPVTLVPMTQALLYGDFTDVRSARLNSLMIGGGVGGAWVFRENWFLSGVMMAYLGVEKSRVEKVTGDSTDSHTPVKSLVKVALGYNGPKYFSGFSIQSDTTNYTVEDVEMRFSAMNSSFFVGAHVDL